MPDAIRVVEFPLIENLIVRTQQVSNSAPRRGKAEAGHERLQLAKITVCNAARKGERTVHVPHRAKTDLVEDVICVAVFGVDKLTWISGDQRLENRLQSGCAEIYG
jgi:hypothetical protein